MKSLAVGVIAILLAGCATSVQQQTNEKYQPIGSRWLTTQEKADHYTCSGVVSMCNVRGQILDCTCMGQ